MGFADDHVQGSSVHHRSRTRITRKGTEETRTALLGSILEDYQRLTVKMRIGKHP